MMTVTSALCLWFFRFFFILSCFVFTIVIVMMVGIWCNWF